MARRDWGHIKAIQFRATQHSEKERENLCACSCLLTLVSPPGIQQRTLVNSAVLALERNKNLCFLLLRIQQYIQSAKVQMTLTTQTYHFCVAKKVVGSGDSLVSAHIQDHLNRSSYSDMWAQSKHNIACSLLHCKYNVYQYSLHKMNGHLPSVVIEAN